MTFTLSNEYTPLARGVGGTSKTSSSDDIAKPAGSDKFTGTENPRELRAIAALMRRAVPREQLDREAGCSNGPELVANLRRKGLDVPCDRILVIDRDGFEVKRGVYHFAQSDRRKINLWLTRRSRNHAA